MNIPKEDLKIWIKALRSGKFKQGKNRLQESKTEYCCLGVACKVLIPKHLLETHGKGLLIGKEPEDQLHSPQWLADIDFNFDVTTGKSLMRLNDEENFTFNEIADLLEAVYIHKVLKE